MNQSNNQSKGEDVEQDGDSLLATLVGIIAMCVVVVAVVATMKYVWQDNWKLPAPFKPISNDQIIKETEKCEDAGLRASVEGSIFHVGGIRCLPGAKS